MNRAAAIFLSTFFHPVFVNLASLMLVIVLNPYLDVSLSNESKWFYIIYVFITTSLIPLLLVVLRKLFGFSSTVMLPDADDRHIPYIVTASTYLFGYYLFLRINAPAPLIAYMLANASILVAVLIINFFTKISAHATSLGAVTGILFAYQSIAETDLRWLFIIALLISGIVGTARLALEAHTKTQVYSGFMLGLMVMWLIL